MSSMQNILNFISAQKDTIDDCIKDASMNYYKDHKDDENFVFEIDECNRESLNLSRGTDLCYDRPGIGFSYSLWYHGRRVNTFLKYFAEIIFKEKDENPKIEIFDLGAGTGAVQWAVALCYVAFKRNNINTPKFKIINIDTSPFMLEYNHKYLWPAFIAKYPEASDIKYEFSVNSWSNSDHTQFSNPWIAASYLFDHTENKEEIKSDFVKLTEKFKPKKLLLLTSNQSEKIAYLNEIASSLKDKGYKKEEVDSGLLFTGTMTKTHTARQSIKGLSGISFSTIPTWNDKSLYGTVLNQVSQRLDFTLFEEEVEYVSLYNPPMVVRRDIKLNERQSQAAKNDGRPTIIVGPAGCGKSVVITERIKNLVEEMKYSPTLRILVTTFNKQLIKALGLWLKDLLDPKQCVVYTNNETSDFHFNGSKEANIKLMHFDVLPTRIGGISDDLRFDEYHKNLLKDIISTTYVRLGKEIPDTFLLDPQFLLEEYHRVRYGLRVNTWAEYETVQRKGRKKALHEKQRAYVGYFLKSYEKHLIESKTSSIVFRRKKFLSSIEQGQHTKLFSHIFVDEFQDCTQADYAIFYGLIKDPNNLTIAGDYAQAVHIGKSADSPRDDANSGERMRNFKRHILEGSYRLPYRISECIKPVSQKIKLQDHEEADVITPYKGSPPGARPIVIYADSNDEAAKKVLSALTSFASFDVINLESNPQHKITILEKDIPLFNALSALKTGIAETDTILRLKGLEKRCILWSTSVNIDHSEEINNFVYTILTRTCGILIIVIVKDLFCEDYLSVIKELKKDRLILWDKQTKGFFESKF